MVELQLPKLIARVRFPSLAPRAVQCVEVRSSSTKVPPKMVAFGLLPPDTEHVSAAPWHAPPMPSAPGTRTVDRRIYFYRLDAGIDASGTPLPLNLSPTIEAVAAVPFEVDSPRYWIQSDGDAIALWPNTPTRSFSEFSLAAIRRSALPQSELNGNLSDLPLARGAGLHEPIHIKIFDNNIMGVEFNFYGPRPSRLPQYLQHVISGSPHFAIQPLLRQDVAEQLERHEELRVLKLFVRRSYVDDLASASESLSDAFSSIKSLSQAKVLGLTLKPEPNQRTSLGKKILKGVKKLAQRPDKVENVITFQAKGINADTGRVEALDLLQDKLIYTRQVVTVGGNSRAVDPTAAFAAIEGAYSESRAAIEGATGLGTIDGSQDHD
jgi:hypothetical protein